MVWFFDYSSRTAYVGNWIPSKYNSIALFNNNMFEYFCIHEVYWKCIFLYGKRECYLLHLPCNIFLLKYIYILKKTGLAKGKCCDSRNPKNHEPKEALIVLVHAYPYIQHFYANDSLHKSMVIFRLLQLVGNSPNIIPEIVCCP